MSYNKFSDLTNYYYSMIPVICSTLVFISGHKRSDAARSEQRRHFGVHGWQSRAVSENIRPRPTAEDQGQSVAAASHESKYQKDFIVPEIFYMNAINFLFTLEF